jgi:hypothetical protein
MGVAAARSGRLTVRVPAFARVSAVIGLGCVLAAILAAVLLPLLGLAAAPLMLTVHPILLGG